MSNRIVFLIFIFASPCDGSPERLRVSFTPTKLFSPNYPDHYSNNVTCEWVLETSVSDNQQFVIQVATLEVEFEESYNPRSKCADYLEAFQGFPGNLGESLGVWCKGYKVVKTTGRFLTLRFLSNEYYTGKGFILEYSLVKSENPSTASSECLPGNVSHIYAGQGPLYEQFPAVISNKSCTWLIEAIDNTGLVDVTSGLVIEPYNIPTISCGYGKFLIYDGPSTQSSLILAWCDGNNFFSQIYTSSSYATLVFETKKNDPEKPAVHTIQLKIYSRKTKYPCNGNNSYPSIQVKKDPVYFSLPFAENDNGIPCKVLVTQQARDYVRIDVKWVEGEVISCDTEAIIVQKLLDKTNEECERECFRRQNPIYLPQTSSVIVTSKLDTNRHVHLKAISTEFYCGGFIESRQAYDDFINEEKIPYMAEGYEVPNNCISQFVIKPRSAQNRTIVARVVWSPPLKYTRVNLDSDTCAGDYLNIYDGSSSSDPLLFSTCNETLAPHYYVNDKVFSTGREMMIQMNTDDAVKPARIKMDFYAFPYAFQCMDSPAILINSTGIELTSPNYRGFYPIDYNCRYVVKTENKDDIVVIEVLDSEFSIGCGDMLSFFNGADGWLSRDFFGRVCGQDKKGVFVSTSDTAVIRFQTDKSGTYGGWKLKVYSREKGFNGADVTTGHVLLTVILCFSWIIVTYVRT